MKFLVLASLKANPPEFGGRREAVAVAEKLIGKWLADGQLDCAYQRIPEGGVVIANADSGEKLWEMVHAYPLYNLFEWRVEPLANLGFVLENQCAAGTRLLGAGAGGARD